jgi:hypothetical protein
MPKKRRRRSTQPETMRRNVAISGWVPRVSFGVRNPDATEPEIEGSLWLRLRGTLFEPLRDVNEVTFSLWPDHDKRVGPARPAAVAHIMRTRPEVEVLASFAPAHFEFIWSLALAGHLTHAYIHFTKPRYGSAEVLNLSFSNEREE